MRSNFNVGFLIVLLITCLSNSAFAQSDINKLDAEGRKHGSWKGYFTESNRVKYEGVFKHGTETGIFSFYDDTKAHTVVATRDFSRGNNSAYTIFFDAKKNVVSEGNVVNKIYDGPWKYYHQNSKTVMTLEYYKNGKLHGSRNVYYPDGKIAEEIQYNNGIKEGPYKRYTATGIVIEEVTYKNNEIDGLAIFRDSEGKVVSKGPFVNGLKKGWWEFYEAGKLIKKEKYPVVKKFQKGKKKAL